MLLTYILIALALVVSYFMGHLHGWEACERMAKIKERMKCE
jgi:hypothetical protein